MTRRLDFAIARCWPPRLVRRPAVGSRSDDRRVGRARERSPPARTRPGRARSALAPNVRALRREVARLERQVELMEQSAENAEDWDARASSTCPSTSRATATASPATSTTSATAPASATWMASPSTGDVSAGREDYLFMHFRDDGCRSDSPQPGGTAEPASVRAASARYSAAPRPATTAARARARGPSGWSRGRSGCETISERFDEWESCVSWVPVTELGDPDQKFGYLFGPQGGAARATGRRCTSTAATGTTPTTCSSRSSAATGRAGTCQDEPGEAVD